MSRSRDIRATTVGRRDGSLPPRTISADVCVVGAGISGVSAALESARLGRSVVLLDSLPVLGGQAVNAIIGTFAGLLSNGPRPYVFTYGIAEDILRDLGADGHLNRRPKNNTVQYDDMALSRWIEDHVHGEGVTALVGAVVRAVHRDGDRLLAVDVATRYGDVRVEAQGFIDASGDAALSWYAGLPCRTAADGPVYGSQKVVLENVVEEGYPSNDELSERMRERGHLYGVTRHDGIANVFPGRGTVTLNMTHIETPLDPLLAAQQSYRGKLETDRTIEFLRGEYPANFAGSTIRRFGLLGVRQTRWIAGRYQLTTEDVRGGREFPDAVARTAWGLELHNELDSFLWEPYDIDHVHYIPFGSLVSPEAGNLVAVGRCIDGDVAALSSVRVMGPCIATGAAGAHALDLAGSGSVHDVPIEELRHRVEDNLVRRDPYVDDLVRALD